MFRSFFTNHLTTELDRELKNLRYSFQLLVDETTFLHLSQQLINTCKSDVSIEIIIKGKSRNKSLRITNLIKRLTDSTAEIYWLDKSNKKETHSNFGILDKSYIIIEGSQSPNSNLPNEFLIRDKIGIFNQLILQSERIEMTSGDISAFFTTDKTIVPKHEQVLIEWNVKNADKITIIPDIGIVPARGQKLVTIIKNTHYQLSAHNNNSEITRKIFIKTITSTILDFKVEVFDPILERYINLEAIGTSILKYGVYNNQQIKLSWNSENEGTLREQRLGELSLSDSYEFKITENIQFSFEFTTMKQKVHSNLQFITFEDVAEVNAKTNLRKMKHKKSFFDILPKFLKIKK